jgi:hypothetical protein
MRHESPSNVPYLENILFRNLFGPPYTMLRLGSHFDAFTILQWNIPDSEVSTCDWSCSKEFKRVEFSRPYDNQSSKGNLLNNYSLLLLLLLLLIFTQYNKFHCTKTPRHARSARIRLRGRSQHTQAPPSCKQIHEQVKWFKQNERNLLY